MTIQDLQQKPLDELIHLAESQPYVSLYYVLAAKRAYHEKHPRYHELLTKAAIRVPSRSILKKYITEKHFEERVEELKVAGKLIEAEDLDTHTEEEVEESNITLLKPAVHADDKLQNATVPAKGEIVLENTQQPKSVETEELVAKEVIVEGPSRKNNRDEKPAIDSITDNDIQFQIVQRANWEQNDSEKQPHLQEEMSFDTEEKHRVKLPIEDDSVDEISEELVIDDDIETLENDLEIEIYEMTIDESKPVSSLVEKEESSMYHRIVTLLQQDEEIASNQSTQANKHIVDEGVDTTPRREQEQIEDDLLDEEEKPTQSISFDEFDHELEQLYAQAAYQATMEQEVQQVEHSDEINESDVKDESAELNTDDEKDHKETNRLADTNERHTFTDWLNQLSSMGSDFYAAQQEIKKDNSSIVEKRQGAKLTTNQANATPTQELTQDQHHDEKPTITTREVQDLARKSLQPNKAYYTETLAYVYELQEKWSKAIEVYEDLALKNPEKSRYFANQIKLLNEKLK